VFATTFGCRRVCYGSSCPRSGTLEMGGAGVAALLPLAALGLQRPWAVLDAQLALARCHRDSRPACRGPQWWFPSWSSARIDDTPLQCESPAAGVRGARSHTLARRRLPVLPGHRSALLATKIRSAGGSIPKHSARRRRRTKVLTNPRTPGTAEELALLGVTAIVTHRDALRSSSRFRTFRRRLGSRLCTRRAYARGSSHGGHRLSGTGSGHAPGFSGQTRSHDAALGSHSAQPSGVAYIGIRSKKAHSFGLFRRDAAKRRPRV